MFGCHKCKEDLSQCKDKPYEEWPCAKCSLAHEYYHTFSTGFFDTGKAEKDEEANGTGYLDDIPDDEHRFIINDSTTLTESEIATLESIKRALSNQIYSTFAHTMVKIMQLGKSDPLLFEALIKKMLYPHMSYSEIGNTMEPKCSKQNVLYHLKRAVNLFPELESVLLVDTRYSGGHYALRTLANKRKQELVDQRIQQNLSCEKINIDDLNKMLRLPFMIRDEVFTFNAFLQDEDDDAADPRKN